MAGRSEKHYRTRAEAPYSSSPTDELWEDRKRGKRRTGREGCGGQEERDTEVIAGIAFSINKLEWLVDSEEERLMEHRLAT